MCLLCEKVLLDCVASPTIMTKIIIGIDFMLLLFIIFNKTIDGKKGLLSVAQIQAYLIYRKN